MADIIEMKMPSPGESITEVEVAQLLVEDGDVVELDQPIAEIDSDKATLELNAEAAGKIQFLVAEGDTVEIGQIVCKIDTSVKPEKKAEPAKPAKEATQAAEQKQAPASKEAPAAKVDASAAKATPVAKAMMGETGVDPKKVSGSGEGGKILKKDVEVYLAGGFNTASELAGWGGSREERKEKMSSLRRKIAERLVSVKNETAMLTTFNEVDNELRNGPQKEYKEALQRENMA